MTPADSAEMAADRIHASGHDCLVIVTDGTTVGVYARGAASYIETMAACAAQVDVNSDFETVEEMRVN